MSVLGKNNALLVLVEGNLCFPFNLFPCLRIFIEKFLDDLSFEQGLIDYLFDIPGSDAGIEETGWPQCYQGSHFTESVATGAFQFYRVTQSLFIENLSECLHDFRCTTGDASSSCANADTGALSLSFLYQDAVQLFKFGPGADRIWIAHSSASSCWRSSLRSRRGTFMADICPM